MAGSGYFVKSNVVIPIIFVINRYYYDFASCP